MKDNYDEAYREADWFGADPSPLLETHADLLPPGARVLDLGVGQGRNALPLARRGCRVTGIDTSVVAVELVSAAADEELLPVTTELVGFREYEAPRPFDAVLCFGLLQMLSTGDAALLCERLRNWVRPGGTLFVTAWHTADPRRGRPADVWQPTGPRSYHDPAGHRHRFYLHPDEILDLFPGWRAVHHWEGLGPEHRHGDGEPERHGNVEAVLVRPERPTVEVHARLSG